MILLEDSIIVQLYWNRDEQAITATADKYGSYCNSIARNILGSIEDSEECVNDTYLCAWNSIPPHKPIFLSTYLGKIVRNLAFNRYKQKNADKRGHGQLPAVLDELSDIVSGNDNVEHEIEQKEIVNAIDAFLSTLSLKNRNIFISRYFYTESISAISSKYNMKEGTVSMRLNRLRQKLHNYLLERGFEL